MAFEVFEVGLDDPSKIEMVKDPPRFFRELLESEGRAVNRLMVDDVLLAEVIAHRPSRVLVNYCVAPPEYESMYIIISVH